MSDTICRAKRIARPVSFPLFLFLIIILLFPLPLTAKTREMTDKNITLAVETRLKNAEDVPAHLIDAETREGVLILSGSVDNILAKQRATQVAEEVKGVRYVINNIEVTPPRREDDVLRKQIRHALASDAATEFYEFDVSVNDGIVTLSGAVDSMQERWLAERVAKGIKGVQEVYNQVVVENVSKDRSDDQIREEVRSRLQWDVRVDPSDIDVAVKDGKVSLSGTVLSARDKSLAATLAWVTGVNGVDAEGLTVDWKTAEKQAKGQKKKKDYSDEDIASALRQAFRYSPRVIPADVEDSGIEIYVDSGKVVLDGTVSNVMARRAAEEIAWNTRGVWNVRNHIKVRPGVISVRDPMMDLDELIGNRVRMALLNDPYVDQHQIGVSVTSGAVRLSGTVDTDFEKRQAAEVVSRLTGVVVINNNLDVRKAWTLKPDREIREDVRDELFWSPFVDAEDISVTVDDGVVTLEGTVVSMENRRAATKNAYDAGAKTVRNRLKVEYGPEEMVDAD